MTPVLLDSSSAILLHKADMADAVASAFALFTVPSVLREITVAGRPGAAWFVRALMMGKLKMVPSDGNAPEVGSLARLGAGERDALIAYRRGTTRFIIIDDRRGIQSCRTMGIPHINALLCPKILFWSGRIDRRGYCTAFEFLLHEGRYSPNVADYARQCTAGQMTFFYP